MTALDVISLEEAKADLVVDYPDKDNDIKRYIATAVAMVENYTGYMLYERETVYNVPYCGYVEVYNYPLTLPDGFKSISRSLSTVVYGDNSVTATVGYSSKEAIPSPLIDAAMKIVTYLFENRDIYTAGLPIDVQLLLNPYRRSATF